MRECIDGYEYDTSKATEIAVAKYLNFPVDGDQVKRALYRDRNGKYFVVERFSWFDGETIIPWSKQKVRDFVRGWALKKLGSF